MKNSCISQYWYWIGINHFLPIKYQYWIDCKKWYQWITIETNADIITIIGYESHIDDLFTSTGVFSPIFTTLHKDCKVGGGGVFLCLHNSISVSEQPSLDSDPKLIGVELVLMKRNLYMFVCSIFYRPPDNIPVPLTQACESVS